MVEKNRELLNKDKQKNEREKKIKKASNDNSRQNVKEELDRFARGEISKEDFEDNAMEW